MVPRTHPQIPDHTSGYYAYLTVIGGILLGILCPVISAGFCAGDDCPGCNATLLTQRLASDLLPFVSDSENSSSSSARETLSQMRVFSQIRFDAGSHPLVHVQVSVSPEYSGDEIRDLLHDALSDSGYSIISGWVYLSDVRRLACLPGVIGIRPVLPPVSGGGMAPLPKADESFSEKEFTGSGLRNSTVDTASVPDEINDIYLSMILPWEEKLSTDLQQVIDIRHCSPNQAPEDVQKLMKVTGQLRNITEGEPEVLVSARVFDTDAILPVTSVFTDYYADSRYRKVEGWVHLSLLQSLAEKQTVSHIKTILPPKTSTIITEGDTIHRTDEIRNISGFRGSGVRVGVISDGVTHLDDAIFAGELPDSIMVLSDTIGGDEGTAMLEIIHDIAPDAELYFHDRGASPIAFIQAVDRLIQSGCRIICDDIIYVEPFFEDGYIAENIRDRILTHDIIYISAAGNAALSHYQARFNGTKMDGYDWHSFLGERNDTPEEKDLHSLYFTIPPHGAGHVVLQWDDPFLGSGNNYDLFLFDSEGFEIARSVNVQDGDDDPIEWCRFINSRVKPEEVQVRVVRAGGEEREIEIYVLPLYEEMIRTDPYTPADSIYAQQAVSEVICVGAASVGGNDSVIIEPFSSQGPVTILFPKEEIRKKPDIVAINRVQVSAVAAIGKAFTGTSAAAPHVAGICADVLSAFPYADSSAIRAALLASATDTGFMGWDQTSGYGLPDAVRMAQMIPPAPPDTSKAYETQKQSDINLSLSAGTQPFQDAINLFAGWNCISIPYTLTEGNNTAEIFSAVPTADHTIWMFRNQETGWVPVQGTDLLIPGEAYWIYSTEPVTIPLKPDLSSDTSRGEGERESSDTRGWHTMGITGTDPVPARFYMDSRTPDWSHLCVYDSQRQEYKRPIIQGREDLFSDSRLLYPGEGFWCFIE
ncbi:MAG: S8 family serine peptidase [Methanospirillaceae archaeon]|nr:S8 family serine peptidase [Methanospirillaceae archaeon]